MYIMTKTIAFITGLSILLLIGCKSANNNEEKKDDECCSKETSDQIVLNTLTKEEAAEGWSLLFDGETTSGWRGFKLDKFPDKGWYAVDGALMIEYSGTGEAGSAGSIITEKKYSNYDLKIDWKISPGGNSGIFLNANESEKYTTIWHTAHEIQVIDDFGYDAVHGYVMNVRQISGAYYDMYTPKRAAAKVQGEWNEARIKMENGHLQHWLNNMLLIDVQLWTPEWEERVSKSKFNVFPDFGLAKEGHIGLQDHGQQVWYRNIRIKEL